MLEEILRSDLDGGHESVELITPLMLLSYAEMLSGENARRLEMITISDAEGQLRPNHEKMEG